MLRPPKNIAIHEETFFQGSTVPVPADPLSPAEERKRFRLPRLLWPGVLEVTHRALDDERFRFTMSIRHPWLGLLFFQTGVFWEARA